MKRLLTLLFSIPMIICSLFGCSEINMTEKIMVTFKQAGYEDKIIYVEKGEVLTDIPNPEQESDADCIVEWNIPKTYKVKENTVIESIHYTKGLIFENYTYNAKTCYAIAGYGGSATKVIIPANYRGGELRRINGDAFKRNAEIEEVVLPEGIEEIGQSAFSYCTNLTSINLPSSITDIKSYAFSESGLSGVLIIPELVQVLHPRTFWNTKIETIIFQEGLQKIDKYVFGNSFGKLKTIVWDINLTQVDINAIYGEEVDTVFYMGDEMDWNSIEILDADGNGEYRNQGIHNTLKNAKIYYFSEVDFPNENNRWHYVDGLPTPW